ncbi:PAS domain S-box protein [Chryseolinea soli]|uniref:histidine kinase n=1 Tax=Chryseolinea soli TaxID=2321403 RepID=A0A385SWC9_9BACT|nr:PAS domain S-box protein [Chryseolinea soli]AYB35142.1 PAS domain S-box protein [Chryseolinea soli]
MSTEIRAYTDLHAGETDALQNLMDSIPALIARVDCNLLLEYANKPFGQWFSRPDKTSGAFFNTTVGKEVFDQVQKHLGKVLFGRDASFNISFFHAGAHRYLDVMLTPEFDSRHHVKGFIFHGTDVTEKMNVQRDLHDYFENANIGLHWVNADGIIIRANPAELKMLGYEEHEYVGQHVSKFHKNQEAIQEIIRRLNNREVLSHFEAELICKDGSTRYVAINSSVLWEGSRFVHTRCFTIDITAQKLAALATQESEVRFKTMANLVPLIIWTTNEHGLCTFLNTKWKELTGENVEDGLGNLWLDVIHPEDRQNIEIAWAKSISERKVFEAKFRVRNDKGGYVVGYANSLPRFDANHTFIGYTGIIQDVTTQEQIKTSLERMVLDRTADLRKKNLELENAEQKLKTKNLELEKINGELSSFAHVASHDLQEPLRKIQTFTNRFVQSEAEKISQQGMDFIRRVQASANRMRDLIQDILSYSKTNQADHKVEMTDLNEILKEGIREFEVKIEETRAVIENKGLPTLPVVPFQFHQLFLNLISNALKFSKPDCPPSILFQYELTTANFVPGMQGVQNFHHIAVSDNGIGFEPQYAEKIFEIFNRLHGQRDVEGTGIGLAICKKVVERHGGKMTAQGELGNGATFHIYLPA